MSISQVFLRQLLIGVFLILSLNGFSQTDSILLQLERLSTENLRFGEESKSIEVISASRSGKSIEELPVSVYVITQEEILNKGYNTLVDVLKSVPGIRVSQPGSAIEGETFLMRGLFGNYYTKILINNLPIQPSAASGMPIGAQLPIKQAERIEIIYGPASAIYGADAMAGVINIITKEADQTIYAQADLSTGEFGYSQINTMFGGKLGKDKNILRYSFYASSTEREDLNTRSKRYYDITYNSISKTSGNLTPQLEQVDVFDPQTYTSDSSYLQNPYYFGDLNNPVMNEMPHKSRLMGVQLKYRGIRASFDYMYRRDHSSIGMNTLASVYTSPDRFFGEYINRFTLGFDKSNDRISLTSNLSYLKYQLDKRSSLISVNDWVVDGMHYKYAASDDIFAEQLFTYRINKNIEMLSGVSFQYSGNLPINTYLQSPFEYNRYKPFSDDPIPVNSNISETMDPFVFNNVGSFLQFYYTHDKLNILAGCRFDKNTNYSSSINPRLALSYRLGSKNILRASYATAFRTPSSYYIYNSIALENKPGSRFVQSPNLNFKPEKLYSYELGDKFIINSKTSLDFTFFQLYISNLINNSIIFDTSAVNLLTLGYLNDVKSSGSLSGLQAALHFNEIIPLAKLDVDIFANYSKGKEVLPLNRGVINDYRMVPKYLGQVNLSVSPINNLMISFQNIFLSRWLSRVIITDPFDSDITYYYQLKGYYTLDVMARYKFSNNFQGFIKAINVFDEKYSGLDVSGSFDDLITNPQFGRNMQFGLSYRMN